ASTIGADDVVIASGIWSPRLAATVGFDLPLVPVEHPYVYGPPPEKRISRATTPFIRWPEEHVYARYHGPRFGIGTYDHVPRPVAPEDLATGAEFPWPGAIFDEAIDRARSLLPASNRFPSDLKLNGVFAITPDNAPLIGRIPAADGLWTASAIWVTHAAVSAKVLAALMTDRESPVAGISALDPARFAGRDPDELQRRALGHYRDIYTVS
ncbi:MAG TPA: FAD-binding oxidoreductase, partial [Thermomicrobiales bacterium]|nr:FAD-binding oxidoreductase [Thermomicrobiales bacterium]